MTSDPDKTPTRQLSRRKGVPLILALALAVIGALLPWTLAAAIPTTHFYGRYVCSCCGAERIVSRGTIAGVTYREEVTLRDTAVSRALNPHHRQSCEHRWFLTRFGKGSGHLFRAREMADGGTGVLMQLLLRDDEFARELAQTSHPREIWSMVVRADAASHERLDDLLGAWWEEGSDRQPFAQWWAANGERVTEFASRKPA